MKVVFICADCFFKQNVSIKINITRLILKDLNSEYNLVGGKKKLHMYQ